MIRSRRAVAALAALAVTVLALTGCAATVSLTPAAHANDPACAAIMVRLPGDLGGQSRRWTDAQATAAWGTPSRGIFSCGVDESEQPRFRITSYGRTPAVQLYLDSSNKAVDPNAVLAQVGRLVAAQTRQTAACTDPATPGE